MVAILAQGYNIQVVRYEFYSVQKGLLTITILICKVNWFSCFTWNVNNIYFLNQESEVF
jgi:hypothetical protein